MCWNFYLFYIIHEENLMRFTKEITFITSILHMDISVKWLDHDHLGGGKPKFHGLCENINPPESSTALRKRRLFSLDPCVVLVQWVKMGDLLQNKDAALAVWWDRMKHDSGCPEWDWRQCLSCNVSCAIPVLFWKLYVGWVTLRKLSNKLTIKLKKLEVFHVG